MLNKDALREYYSNGQLEWIIPIEWHVYGSYRFHGKAICYYPTGEKKIEKTYEHGKIVGSEIMYYKSGAVMSELPYKNGMRNGKFKYNHPDGTKEECEYKDGVIVQGSVKKTDKKGKEKKEKEKSNTIADNTPKSVKEYATS